jgi:enoyl-CoA hydratase/carnithine racemase
VSDVLLYETRGPVAWLTMNRPEARNAQDTALIDAIDAALDKADADDDVRVVVLAGAGRAFCPGHDLKEMLANSNEAFIGGLFRRCCDVMLTMRRLPQPVIAKVQGIATAAGCQLVAAADMAVAAADARFATSGINYGLFCATPGVPVSRNIATKRAFEMVMTGEFIDAPTALAWGLVNRVVAPESLDDEVSALATGLMAKPRRVLAAGKEFFYRQLEQNLVDAYASASELITRNMLGPEAQEGVSAFVEKREPRWTD